MDEPQSAPRHASSRDWAELRQRLAEVYAHGAEVLEETARLTDEHAAREAGRSRGAAASERAAAARASREGRLRQEPQSTGLGARLVHAFGHSLRRRAAVALPGDSERAIECSSAGRYATSRSGRTGARAIAVGAR